MENFIPRLISFLLFFAISSSTSTLRHRGRLTDSDDPAVDLHSISSSSSPSPTTFFEVRRPIPVPKSKPCSTLVLKHDFAYTYGSPPVTATYSPPSHCHFFGPSPSRIVLEWSAASSGRQFDRIFGLWLAGVELLRSCTAEPRPTGIVWTVRKDVTRYRSLFSQPQTLAVFLGNIVDETYTGVYHVNVSFHFYFARRPPPPVFDSPADLIIPISNSLPLNDGLWFQIKNSTAVQGKNVTLPRNAYRAAIEVYISYHSNDEFWYTNPPNSYISKNNLTGIAGNGAFREVTVRLDGDVVGAIWPFTVIYTGGINPLLWRPISAIGSFDLPSYDIEITPFLGRILDGKGHSFEFGVTNALDVWFIDANLHLWLDSKSSFTEGSLIEYQAPGFVPSLISNFSDLDGDFDTVASRTISATGWLKSSFGKITTHFFQRFDYSNKMKFSGNGSAQAVNQSIFYNHGTYAKNSSTVLHSEHVFQIFPLYVYIGTSDQDEDSYLSIANVTVGFDEEKRYFGEKIGFSYTTLRNLQSGEGVMHVKGNRVTSGVGSTRQVYGYESNDGCYFRNVSSSNYTILYDESGESCTKNSWFRSSGHLPIKRKTI
ncbi:hypothetical protein KSP39_PZI013744 [Platanthera zijinensis]|uniref:Peptide N-acetyl-beta-D-glucosaminyl asparaginase amidase A N-terminal domain-containing protein n=1 Tax=Platanthera zijinensis TaxID=2320716 RepID=A0AAP0BDM4_9ASPA